MSRNKTAVTIRDVATAAGVSVSTVSRVLNDKDDVAPATYQKVRDVIDNLGYTSSLAARGMRSRRMNVIGLTVWDVESTFSIQVMKGVNRATAELGYDLIVYTGGEWARVSAADRERRFLGLVSGGIADGVIVVTPHVTRLPAHSPVVVVDPNVDTHGCPAVISTNKEGMSAAMDYVIGLGHSRIGFIGGRPDLQCAVQRLQAYKDSLARSGIPLDATLIQEGDFTRRAGFDGAEALLRLPDPPTAIMASNDQSAIGAMKAIHKAGLRVPDDVSVVGFDNIPDAAYANPGLTTVDQSIVTMGHIAAETLVRLIEGEVLETDLFKVPTRLIVRDSCGEPRAAPIRFELGIGASTAEVDQSAGAQLAGGGDTYWQGSGEIVVRSAAICKESEYVDKHTQKNRRKDGDEH